MPAAGESSTARAPSLKNADKSKVVQPTQSRRESCATVKAQRPDMKSRAYSTSGMHKTEAEDSDDDEITDDTFFQRYHFPQSVEVAQEVASDPSPDSSSDTEGPLSPTAKARQSLGDVVSESSSGSAHSDSTPTMPNINIAIIGHPGSGKSTFIRRALSLPDSTPPNSCSRKWTIDGIPYKVRFFEVPICDVQIGERNTVKWPETIHGMPTPKMDGAIIVYDVTAQQSLLTVLDILNVLIKAHIPLILVATKCDQSPVNRELEPAVVEHKVKALIGDVIVFKASESTPEIYRRCLFVVARAAIVAKRSQSQHSMARRRANSSAVLSLAQKDLWNRKHERASSELSVRFPRNSTEVKSHRYKPSDANKTFFNAEESPGCDTDSDDQDSDHAPSIMSMKPSDENGYTFDQLVDRLLAQPMSKFDTKFVSIFLALYRRFATPSQLLEAILTRFNALADEIEIPIMRMIAQLRHLAVLQQWVCCYPGDFAYAATRKKTRKFVQAQAAHRDCSTAAAEIMRDLEMVAEDDDTDWACNDWKRAQLEQMASPSFHNNVLDEESSDDELTSSTGHMSVSLDGSTARNSVLTAGTQSTGESGGSSQTVLSSVEKNERLARQLEPNPLKPLSKIQWHQLMNESEEAVAKELTRIDWIMFSSVRPRDLVRHVSLNADEKKNCKNLENVTRMTDHFNHVAFLVSNYILLRDKPKHRALMLEKWMKIARKLRKLNNYNSLGAVMAGVKSTSIHRLIATRELVPQTVSNDFLKLDILMGPQKSHFAYRLAWENSSGERIPYIPLHRRDLVSASEGNATFVGEKKKTDSTLAPHPGTSVYDSEAGKGGGVEPPASGVSGKQRINWRKFEIMGEVIVGVQRAQGTPYPNWQKCEVVRNLILDVKITKDEDELYDRSTALEAPGAHEKGRFAKWFRER